MWGLCEDCDEYCMCVGYVRTVMNTVSKRLRLP